MDRDEILAALTALAAELEHREVSAEMYVVGGAAIALAFDERRSTRDIDAVFQPKAIVYESAEVVAGQRGLPAGWLNDAVKGFLAGRDPAAAPVLDLPGLRCLVASPATLLALKVLAHRVGEDEAGTPEAQLPYDHGTGCVGAAAAPPFFNGNTPACTEVFLYDAAANDEEGKVICASCNPAGAHTSATDASLDVKLASALRTSHLNHALSDDGRFVFFQTGERLVTGDTNGDTFDVYRYDSLSERAELISSGTSPFPSFFLDASADGYDVFFRTRERLAGWDMDELSDLYDARVGGGVPEPVSTAQCAGDSCQGGAGALPATGTAASAAFSGPGDRPTARRCPKGKARRHGRCVARKRHSSKHHRANNDRRASR